ncbi:MAG: M20/M25/M40 family metallo-hydrolase [Clostridia bacterium]|nr:M20/M25/M40 family metallo-hydrolase [Clostridia bacterium]
MKLSELDLNPVAKIRESTNFTVREVKKVCKNIGPRAPGSENENKAQDYVIETCSKFADTVEKEPFKVASRAFMAWPRVCAIAMLIGVIIYALTNFISSPVINDALCGISLAIALICVVIIVFDFLLYKPILDPFFKKTESSNVVFTKKPTGEVKRRIIFSGHMDSSHEWTYNRLGGAKLVTTVVVLAIVGISACIIVNVLSIIFDLSDTVKYIFTGVEGVSVVFFMIGYKYENTKVVVDGANDDLTGVFASLAVLQFLTTNDIKLENTEVIAVSMGSEEAGLRGAKEFVKKHDYSDVETVFISVDTLRDFEYMAVFNKDMTGLVKHDKQAAALLKKASEMSGLDLPYSSVWFGSSDAAAITQGGMKAVLLAAMDPAPARYYHTVNDTADNLDLHSIEKGVEVLINTTLLFDEQGLKDKYE